MIIVGGDPVHYGEEGRVLGDMRGQLGQPHVSTDQEAERKGRKWDQTANLKSNPSLPHSCFLQLDHVSKGFHNLPKAMLYHLGTKYSDAQINGGHFASVPQQILMLEDHMRKIAAQDRCLSGLSLLPHHLCLLI